MSQRAAEQPTYVLGHSEHELARLEQQSLFYRPHTLRFLTDAGVAAGQHVLDVGCGVGDVAFAAAELVGPAGSVIGVDRAAPAIETARSRAAVANHVNVRFAELDIDDDASISAAGTFDAVVGRFVLMYTSDPVDVLRRLRARLRPGGLLAFIEMDMSISRSWPPAPTAEQCGTWIRETFTRANIETDPGLKLYSWFTAAGLIPHHAGTVARMEGGPDSPAYGYLANTMRSLLPMMERLGVTTAQDVQIDTLADRLFIEVTRSGGAFQLPLLTSVAARVDPPVS